jgi:hypothetical protein
MARLECSRGWGKVYDPETDRDVSIGEDISPDLAERMAERYGPITAIVDSNEDPECGVNGCSRSVDDPESVCWQH